MSNSMHCTPVETSPYSSMSWCASVALYIYTLLIHCSIASAVCIVEAVIWVSLINVSTLQVFEALTGYAEASKL